MARPWNQRHRCMTSLVLLWGLWASTVAAATWQATTDSLSTGVDTDLVLTLEGTQTDGGTTSPISKGDAVPNITATLYGSFSGSAFGRVLVRGRVALSTYTSVDTIVQGQVEVQWASFSNSTVHQ